ncbi:ABC transporter substrate-binding protein [Subtercola frigoramans]|uniref:Peptide/nickel transport system substrate-binding protein n=1 Tax=Subtercola frigoramans TaxID=120298 RepID=A0ABS2L9B6_9MICO|nr:ABC transporter substrate-binding protein [Subtercola frigoramans]MBM7473677.1 peptide/nickel transport system substrate-binding protein [Subtercola frigoramans]
MKKNVIQAVARRPRRTLAFAAVVSVAALTLAGCASSDSGTAGATESKTLTLVAAAAPTSINPALANADTVGSWYSQLTYDPLIRLAPDGTLQPDLATSWKFLDDQSKELELTLRTGVKFSDGTEMTSEAVADSINYIVTNGVNGKAWLGGADTKAEATGADTVVMHLATSNSTVPRFLTQRSLTGSVIAPTGLADPETLKNKTFGAGPYVLDTEHTVAGSSYVYIPNTNYWNPDNIHYGKVVIQVSGSNAASYQALAAGDADIMRGDLATATSAKAAGLTVKTTPASILGINFADRDGTVVPELADIRVRQALSYAIDRETIVKAAWGEDGLWGSSLTLPENAGFSKTVSDAYAYDPAKAKKLLADAGLANGFSFTIASVSTAPADAVTQAIVQNWADIGVKATIAFYSDASLLSTDALAKKFGVLTYYYGAGQTGGIMNDFLSGSPTQYNPFGSTDPAISEALAAAKTSADPDSQSAAYEKAMTVGIIDDAWVTNVAYAPSFVIMSDKVAGTDFGSALTAPDIAQLVKPAGN